MWPFGNVMRKVETIITDQFNKLIYEVLANEIWYGASGTSRPL